MFAQQLISEEKYNDFKIKYDAAKLNLTNREKEIRKVADRLEVNLEFLGVTGVEDKLQDQVGLTIESLKNAGINVWMLTGDKVETAKCISVMSGIKTSKD